MGVELIEAAIEKQVQLIICIIRSNVAPVGCW